MVHDGPTHAPDGSNDLTHAPMAVMTSLMHLMAVISSLMHLMAVLTSHIHLMAVMTSHIHYTWWEWWPQLCVLWQWWPHTSIWWQWWSHTYTWWQECSLNGNDDVTSVPDGSDDHEVGEDTEDSKAHVHHHDLQYHQNKLEKMPFAVRSFETEIVTAYFCRYLTTGVGYACPAR